MSILRRSKGQVLERYYNSPDFPISGPAPLPGISITQGSALRATAVWACVRLISETVASLPVHVYRRNGDLREVLDPPQWLVKPNPETTRFELFERTLAALNLDGNAYWYFTHDNLGRVSEVWAIPPSMVQVERDRQTKEITYRVDRERYTSTNIVHIRAFPGMNDLKGMSPISNFATSIGLGMAAEEYGTRFFGQGASLSGVIQTPQNMSEDALKVMAKKWDEDHQGVSNAHKPGFLTGGATWQPVSIPNDDAQFLETREFQVTEIARIFRVQPHMIGDLTRATFSNIEQQSIEFVVHTIRPWLVRLESALAPLLLDNTYLKFNVEGLLRGDTLSRYQAYAIAIQNHWMNSDEVREKEDMDPIPEGDGQTFYGPVNQMPLGAFPTPEAPKTDVAEMIKALSESSPVVNVTTPDVTVNNAPPAIHLHEGAMTSAIKGMSTDIAGALSQSTDRQLAEMKDLRHEISRLANRPVKVAAPQVTVEPPPARSRRVERDEDGNITRIVEE